MKTWAERNRWFAGLAVLLALCTLLSSTKAHNDPESDSSLLRWAFVVKDPTGTKTQAEVLQAARSGQLLRLEDAVFSTNFSSAAVWFVVPLKNKQTVPLPRLLVLEPSWLDDIQVTLTDAQGGMQTFTGGDTHAFERRSEPYRLSNFALSLPPGASTLVMRVQTRDPFFVNALLLSNPEFAKFGASEALYYGLIYGGVLSLLLFNLVLYLSSREKNYIAYCALLATFLVMHATYSGHVFQWLFPQYPEAGANWIISTFVYLYSFSGLVFAQSFLDLKVKHPTSYAWTRRILLAMVFSFVASAALGGYRAHVITSIVWVTAYSVTAFVLGLLSLKKLNDSGRYYLSGSIGGLVGSSITALVAMGVIPYSFWTFRAVDFGMLLDATMLSLALSARLEQASRLERLRRFFSPAVADQLLTASSDELYRPHHRDIVVLFLDLRGYTAFTQTYGADEVMKILGEFHAAMGELISLHQATLERFAGDGIMIFLNDPVEIPDAPVKAVTMAMAMQARFDQLNNEVWRARNYSLSMGIGIAQGMATIGAIGFEGRRDYAAIGSVTNLAARLCSEARGGQILLSGVVASNINTAVDVKSVGTLTLKGFNDPVPCYEVCPATPTQPIGPWVPA